MASTAPTLNRPPRRDPNQGKEPYFGGNTFARPPGSQVGFPGGGGNNNKLLQAAVGQMKPQPGGHPVPGLGVEKLPPREQQPQQPRPTGGAGLGPNPINPGGVNRPPPEIQPGGPMQQEPAGGVPHQHPILHGGPPIQRTPAQEQAARLLTAAHNSSMGNMTMAAMATGPHTGAAADTGAGSANPVSTGKPPTHGFSSGVLPGQTPGVHYGEPVGPNNPARIVIPLPKGKLPPGVHRDPVHHPPNTIPAGDTHTDVGGGGLPAPGQPGGTPPGTTPAPPPFAIPEVPADEAAKAAALTDYANAVSGANLNIANAASAYGDPSLMAQWGVGGVNPNSALAMAALRAQQQQESASNARERAGTLFSSLAQEDRSKIGAGEQRADLAGYQRYQNALGRFNLLMNQASAARDKAVFAANADERQAAINNLPTSSGTGSGGFQQGGSSVTSKSPTAPKGKTGKGVTLKPPKTPSGKGTKPGKGKSVSTKPGKVGSVKQPPKVGSRSGGKKR